MCGAGEAKRQPNEASDEAGAVDHGGCDSKRLSGLGRSDCASRIHRLHRYRSTIYGATDDHSNAEREQHAKGIHLKYGEIRDYKGNERAEITERASDFHPVVAVRRWLRGGTIRCHAAADIVIGVLYEGSSCGCHCPVRRIGCGAGAPAQAWSTVRWNAGARCEGPERPANIADLRAGRGMGLAQAAELNGYSGPLHVRLTVSASAPISAVKCNGYTMQ